MGAPLRGELKGAPGSCGEEGVHGGPYKEDALSCCYRRQTISSDAAADAADAAAAAVVVVCAAAAAANAASAALRAPAAAALPLLLHPRCRSINTSKEEGPLNSVYTVGGPPGAPLYLIPHRGAPRASRDNPPDTILLYRRTQLNIKLIKNKKQFMLHYCRCCCCCCFCWCCSCCSCCCCLLQQQQQQQGPQEWAPWVEKGLMHAEGFVV